MWQQDIHECYSTVTCKVFIESTSTLLNQPYVQMPQARVWAHYIFTLALFLPDHHDLNSCVNPEPQLKV